MEEQQVALRKESVDRNALLFEDVQQKAAVALRKESVDRNRISFTACWSRIRSLSARRAWIEMMTARAAAAFALVALRKESVDRNLFVGGEWTLK